MSARISPRPAAVGWPELQQRVEELGRELARRWAPHHGDEAAFPRVAADVLSSFAALDHLPIGELARWVMETDQLPTQSDVEANFGEPPLTLFTGPGFQINLLFWLDGTTTIHQHMFSGAFRVAAGSSIHSEYHFTGDRRINSRLRLGCLQLQRAELLEAGETRAILPGAGLIHALFHLDRPSATLLVRTRGEEDVKPQFDYLPPGIALDTTRTPRELRKRLQFLRMLQRLDHPEFLPCLLALIAGATLENTVRLLLHPGLVGHPAARAALAAKGLAEARDWIVPAYDDRLRTHRLVSWRAVVTDPRHRFFLALLLNLPSRERILTFVRDRYGGDPAQTIVGWVGELAALQRAVPGAAPLIDLPFEDRQAAALLARLRGIEGAAPGSDDLVRSSLLAPLLVG